MANLLLGSSNVNRHYKFGNFPKCRKYEMVKCTQRDGFATYMENLNNTRKSVLISVFENFVVDAVGADVAAPEAQIDECSKDFLSIILSAAIRLPGTRFGIVMPMGRPAAAWYHDRLDPITQFLEEGVKAMISDKNINNVAIIDCVTSASQQFEEDQVHLTKASAGVFLEVILNQAEKFFNATLIDLTSRAPPSLEERIWRLEKTMGNQADKNTANNLMFARLREEVDTRSNTAKEDRVVINGLTSATPLPSDPRLRIEALKVIVGKIFQELIDGFEGRIVYLSQGKQQGAPLPMVEAKLDKPEFAIAIRKAFADKKKKNLLRPELSQLFLSNSVNLATRVRIDILKALSKKVAGKDEIAYVAGFTSKPMLHIRRSGAPLSTTKPLRSFSFIEAITRYGDSVELGELETAYGRAGRSFNGQLQQNFVILNEFDQGKLQPHIARGTGVPRGPTPGGSGTGARGGGPGGVRGTKRTGDSHEESIAKK